jgi:hypothetical protein
LLTSEGKALTSEADTVQYKKNEGYNKYTEEK